MAMHPSRRDMLRGLAAVTGASLGTMSLLDPRALAQSAADPRFLIVFTASGGGSIIDGPLAIRASESANAATLNTFADQLVTGWEGSPFRAVDLSGSDIGPIPASFSTTPSEVLGRRRHDLMVSTWTRTSVNHHIGQRRSITGNEAWSGRTLQEMVAWQYGAESPIPNVQLLAGVGYAEHGTDGTVPTWARGQLVANPATWPLSLDGSRGQPAAMDPEVLAAVRRHRNEVFEPATRFQQVFGSAPRLLEWQDLRGTPQERIEALDLITKLTVQPDSAAYPLSDFGLESSPASEAVRAAFPYYATDPLHAQAALAFLLLKYRVSVTVTLGPSFDFVYDEDADDYGNSNGLPLNSVRNPPLAFDVSHQGHRTGQSVVWDRIYKTIDGLISLLESEDFGDGTSLWDRTMIYVASDFGREKTRPANASDWGTGHSLNNGVQVFSPLVPGDTLLGGVDPDTGLTYGYDPQTGEPEPGREMAEAEVFSGLLGALSVDTTDSGLPSVPAMTRS
ncbi:MAG: hypothetical protein H6741_32750 [Alphaproteobacteria bacterium]|nr:hypothetical protein [Alphaproteobacteria bacterium]MCB9797486.1 hypothetical protein [Alphaproteobacteria bacterium]